MSNEEKWYKKIFSGYGGILIVLILFIVLFSTVTDTFFKPSNLILVIRQASNDCLIAFGMTVVLICGSIDLSVGSIYGLSAMLAAKMIVNNGMPIPVAFLVAATCGIAIGLLNGLIITQTTIPPFIATLGVSYVARGLAYLSSGGTAITVMDDKFNRIGTGTLFNIPVTIWYMLIVMVILGTLLSRTQTGKYIYACGSNPTAAKFAGINTTKMKIMVHIISGLLAGLAGVISIARLFSATPNMGNGNEIDAIAAVVIGGTSMAGGSGSLTGTLIGAIIIAVMGNGLNHMGLNTYWQQVVKGILIIVAVGLDGLKKKMAVKQLIKKANAK